MRILKIKEFAKTDFPTSRKTAEILREKARKTLKRENFVVFDFEGVSGITQGFGDELVGLLIAEFGIEKVKEKVKVVNANEKVRLILNWVAGYRNSKGAGKG